MYYLLLYDVVDGFVDRRTPHRQAHLQLAREAHERGELILAGAFADPADGAALLFQAHDRSVVERFAASDPYVTAGLVEAWRVRTWTVVIGGNVAGRADERAG
jgi:uncharacterized protein